MAEDPTTDRPAEPVVPQTRTAADSDGEPQPRKRAAKAAKRATRSKAAKEAAEASAASSPAAGESKPHRRKRASRAVADASVTADELPLVVAASPSTEAAGAGSQPAEDAVVASTGESSTDASVPAEEPAPVDGRGPADESAPTEPTPTQEPAPAPTEEAASGPAGEAEAPVPARRVTQSPEASPPERGEGWLSTAPGEWVAAAWDAVRHFDQPPERLAELAVADLGPRAAAWVAWLRTIYPNAPAAGIARLAARQASRHGVALAALDLAGPLAAPVYLSAGAWVRATLVLRIAAAYGHDPTDPRRVRELLELLDLADGTSDASPSREPSPVADEREPSGAASGPAPVADEDKGVLDKLNLLKQAGARVGVGFHLVGLLPFRRRRRRNPLGAAVRALYAASEQADDLDRLAHKAILRYRATR